MDRQMTFGVSAAATLERHMEFILRRFRVDVRDGHARIADLNRLSSGLRLTVERDAPREKLLEHAAVQLGYVALGFEQPPRVLAMYCDNEREELRQVLAWAAWALIPDQAMHEAEQEEWDDLRLAYECGVSLRMARVRIKWWVDPPGRRPEPLLGEVVQLRQVPLADDGPSPIRYEPGRRIKGLQVPIPEDRERFLRETTKRWKDGESRFF